MKTLYKIEISPIKFWLLAVPGFFITIALLAIVSYYLVDKQVMPKLVGVNNRWEVTVPKVVGMPVDSAKGVCASNGLRITESRTEYNDAEPINTIISQDPVEGEPVKQGRHIMVVVSKGSEIATVPSLIDLQEGPAKRALREAGFNNISVSTSYNSSVKKDACVGTDPVEGSVTSREARVTVLISKGSRPTKTLVPDLLGAKLSDAQSAIEVAGLKTGSLTYESHPETSPGIVIRQSATAGSSIPLESRVNLVISIK